jgi:hypothetical protein
MGFGTGGRWDDVVRFFDAAWDAVLERLNDRFKV